LFDFVLTACYWASALSNTTCDYKVAVFYEIICNTVTCNAHCNITVAMCTYGLLRMNTFVIGSMCTVNA